MAVKPSSAFNGHPYGFSFIPLNEMLQNRVADVLIVDVICKVVDCGDLELWQNGGRDVKRMSFDLEDVEFVVWSMSFEMDSNTRKVNSSTTETKKRKEYKDRSEVWAHYTKFVENGEPRAKYRSFVSVKVLFKMSYVSHSGPLISNEDRQLDSDSPAEFQSSADTPTVDSNPNVDLLTKKPMKLIKLCMMQLLV
ncbi:hypothetical protein QVD17_28772 [Tagetes erecta]|uniref:Uncharacterized protein n=1 Tax=Tagetes erecta TaxID=13708 RepID=A0AAD8KHA0_TARER|nr:hypothetical protein QVD17_28772 [Tagetes erecta]